ncbi:MAG: hypothetical protein D4R56_06695 [Deltaproteobacteria bacterium]|nr:MAG: hypothetical protein D4R56_06695 [Deltaproteobacteria bacterium]
MQPTDRNNDFVRQFLYGPGTILPVGDHATADILMDERMEGWIGIPHGGIGMGIMMDLAMHLDAYPSQDNLRFPVSADFRFAGTSIRIGDLLHFDVMPVSGGAEGSATVDRDPLPYMSSSIRYQDSNGEHGKSFSAFMPQKCNDILNELSLLPSYRNCFVCGIERNHPGLKRQFSFWETSDKIVVSPVGFSNADQDSFYRFSRNGFLHPLPFLALLDEILGWGGILLTGSGAVTVGIDFTFYRPVSCNEKLLFFGHGDRVRGRPSSRLLFWASGGAASVGEDGTLEMVASTSGQWFGIQDLTRQMRSYLLPRTLMERAFQLTTPSAISRS